MPEPFVHRYIPPTGGSAETLLLLHGTGGDEEDLLLIGHQVRGGAGLLSPRGKVLENGMPRFFRRLAMGVFDLEDLRFRTHELAGFIRQAAGQYGFDPAKISALGYSNGANIAASLLLLDPGVLARAVLLRGMVPLVPDPLPDLARKPVFLAGGRGDPFVRPEQTEDLAKLLQNAGAAVELHWSDSGHALDPKELATVRDWLASGAAKTVRS